MGSLVAVYQQVGPEGPAGLVGAATHAALVPGRAVVLHVSHQSHAGLEPDKS